MLEKYVARDGDPDALRRGGRETDTRWLSQLHGEIYCTTYTECSRPVSMYSSISQLTHPRFLGVLRACRQKDTPQITTEPIQHLWFRWRDIPPSDELELACLFVPDEDFVLGSKQVRP